MPDTKTSVALIAALVALALAVMAHARMSGRVGDPAGWCVFIYGGNLPSLCSRTLDECQLDADMWKLREQSGHTSSVSDCHPVDELWCAKGSGDCYAEPGHCTALTSSECRRMP